MANHKTGGDVDAYCNKCKLVLAHIILAMNGTKIMKVECKTCRGVHAFRAEAAAKRTPAASGRTRVAKSKTASAASGAADYELLTRGKDLSRAQRYRISVNYTEGDVLDHPFGLGVVTRCMSDGKIEVAFPAGTKVLAHNRPS